MERREANHTSHIQIYSQKKQLNNQKNYGSTYKAFFFSKYSRQFEWALHGKILILFFSHARKPENKNELGSW